ncbi:hypothetical protein Glove_29g159 [Diversispora epigaea]|uniref:Uncharacterized protein n=1 Tax=Diversispora epigaea TaxID=1348612 RepID=A0A397JSK2_9GLOM|nr:hypothetical protein Glove_29g159 [Diversispora epigaea]
MFKRNFSQIKNDNNHLILLRRFKRGSVSPPRRYTPSPSPVKRRGHPTKKGSGQDALIKMISWNHKPERPNKRARVDNNVNYINNNDNKNNNNTNNNNGDNIDEKNVENKDGEDNLDFLFDPNGLIMLSNASGYLCDCHLCTKMKDEKCFARIKDTV